MGNELASMRYATIAETSTKQHSIRSAIQEVLYYNRQVLISQIVTFLKFFYPPKMEHLYTKDKNRWSQCVLCCSIIICSKYTVARAD